MGWRGECGAPHWTNVGRVLLGSAVVLGLLLPASVLAKSDPGKQLAKVQAALASNRSKKALKALRPMREGPLADHVGLLRARVLRGKGELDEALEAAREALSHEPPSELAVALFQEVARIHIARGDLLAAHQAQRQGWESSRNRGRAAELMLELAQDYEKASLPGDALRLHRGTWERWPGTDAGDRAYLRSQELEAGTGAAPPPGKELIRLADRRRIGHRCAMSLGIYERALSDEGLEPTDRRGAEVGRADCLFAAKRYEEAIEAYETLVAGKSDDFHPRVQLARSHARNGNDKLALRQLDKIAREAGPATRARTQYLSALLVGPPESKAARARLRKVEQQRSVPALARLARWRLAWSDFQAGEYSEAGRRLQQLAQGDLFDVEVQRALYWLAAAELEQDRREEGRALLRRFVEDLPLSYYGFLAADRLGEPVLPTRSFLPSRKGKTEDRAATRAAWLERGGFPELVRLELESRLRAAALTLELRVRLAQLLHSIGDHFEAVRVVVDGIGDSLERGIDPAWQEVWELAWPRPYPETVERAAQEFEAEWALVYAVMREESRYRPDVVSPVGARGLMQILPPTGEQIAKALGVSDFDEGRLFQPETSIRFGSYYLRQLLRRFDGRWPLAIAAYNAGPEVVSIWVEDRGSASRDLFVDSIPYAETRRYLRRVLRSRWVYELLYGGEKVARGWPQPERPAGR